VIATAVAQTLSRPEISVLRWSFARAQRFALVRRPHSPLSSPPAFRDRARQGSRQPEHNLGRRVTDAIRPALVTQAKRIAESFLDEVDAQQRKLQTVGDDGCECRLPCPRRARDDDDACGRHAHRLP
jgi:hypothetical protein